MINFFYNLIIQPIITLYEIVFGLADYYIFVGLLYEESVFMSILFVSVVFNLLTYPLYKKADELQNEARLKKEKMSKWVDHIKKNFKGDERFFILSAYYKENDFSPLDQLKESLSLLIQIPFFAAAYIFFTSMNYYENTAFNAILLREEDALLHIGEMSINILPILMTLINIISACIYTKGFKFKDKISSFVLPILFLIILYHSPSALVIYWTSNNIISLIKNIILKNKSNHNIETNIKNSKDNNTTGIISVTTSIFLFLGIIIPSLVIKASPEEFDSIYYSLFDFIYHTATIYLGLGLWILVFYVFAKNKKRFVFVLTVLNIYMVINHMLYINDVGFITTLLSFAMPANFPIKDMLLNVAYLLFTIIILKVISLKFDIVPLLARAMCISFALWSIINVGQIIKRTRIDIYTSQPQYVHKIKDEDMKDVLVGDDEGNYKRTYIKYMQSKEYNSREEDGSRPVFNVSKKGKNVIFLCLDCFVGEYYKYAIAIMPELKEAFEGFTVYTNAFSFGPHTRVGAPAMYGGYEYSAYEMNKRKDEIVDKHNEAITLMPKLFSDEGYKITTMDIPWENYYDATRESVWKDLPNVTNIHMYDTIKSDIIEDKVGSTKEVMEKRFVHYSIMKTAPLVFKIPIYNEGFYLCQTNEENSYPLLFLQSFAIMDKLSDLANIVDDDSNNVFITHNMMIHEESMLNYPDFYPDGKMWDSSYMDGVKNEDGNIFYGDKKTLGTTVAALKELSKFLKYLKDNDVYDNTRIIVTADHGNRVIKNEFDESFNVEGSIDINMLTFNPILMYKDFNAKGYEESDELMSNADASYLALKDISKEMKNPWTGKELSMDYKKEHDKFYMIGNVSAVTNYFIGRSSFHPIKGVWGEFSGDKVLDHKNWALNTEIEKAACLPGYEHNIVHKNKTEVETCGTNYSIDMYECSICGKCFKDEGGVEFIKNYEEYKYEVPHKFINYTSDNNDSEKNHGTKTAECEYGCGTKDTIYDDSVNMHHHFVNTTKKATMTSDGYTGSECDKCHLLEPGKDVKIIPQIKEVKLENEYVEMTSDKNNAVVIITDKNGDVISNDNVEIKYFDNENFGNAYALITFKKYYENKNELNEDEAIRLEYKIVPARVKIKSVEHKRSNLMVSIETGKGRVNEVEIIVDDKEDKPFTFKKTEKNEYKVNLTDFNNEASKIKVRVVRHDNTTGEALYSSWVEGEVD